MVVRMKNTRVMMRPMLEPPPPLRRLAIATSPAYLLFAAGGVSAAEEPAFLSSDVSSPSLPRPHGLSINLRRLMGAGVTAGAAVAVLRGGRACHRRRRRRLAMRA